MANQTKPMGITAEQATERLETFLANNPASSIGEIAAPQNRSEVKLPWGDESIAICIPEDALPLIDSLNSVYLPERFTAIWHTNDKRLEIIWTSSPLPPDWLELVGRKFTFKHEKQEYECEFGASSNVLLVIAENFTLAGQTFTQYRNLTSFKNYVLAEKGVDGYSNDPDSQPRSFWINGISEWNDDGILDLIKHLNFYMAYYDKSTPTIYVHSPRSESKVTPIRYPFERFPKHIDSRPVDSTLLHFWEASQTGDPARRFLYNFQILEYASYFYLENSVRKAIKKAVSAPDASDKIDSITQQIAEAVSESKLQDVQKIEHLIRGVVNPDLVWNEIKENIEFFSNAAKFDGGFSVEPIIDADYAADNFRARWLPGYSEALRKIRNALSHGREQRMVAVITPTVANFERLQAWVPVIAVAAREVMVYRSV